MSNINEAAVLKFYLDTQEYSDRLAAIEAQAATSLATQKSEVAAAIANLSLEVSNVRSDITQQFIQDRATYTQEIQDALVYLKDEASVASALRTPRKIQTVPFDGTQDINLPVFTSEIDGLVPKRVGTTTTKYLREDGTWEVPPDTSYPLLTQAKAEAGTATTANTISARVLKDAILHHTPVVTDITGNAGTATKLQTSRTVGGVSFDGTVNIDLPGVNIAGNQDTTGNAATATKLATAHTINGVSFDGSANITLPLASSSVSGTVQLNNTLTSTDTNQALTAAQGKTLNDSKLAKTENAVSASKLQTSRTISLTGGIAGSISFDGSEDVSIAATVTGLGVANGIATLDSNGQVPSNQLPSYVDDVLEYPNVAAFPPTGETGKIYVETTGNTTYRWSGSGYVKITSGEVASVAGKTGVVTLTKTDVGLPNVDNTADSVKSVATAAKLTTARTIGGISFDGSANINLPGVNTPGNQSTSANAGSATRLETARTLTVGNTGKTFDGSANVGWTVEEVLPSATSGQFLKFDGTAWIAAADNDTTYSAMSQAEANTGTDTTNRVITAAVLKEAIQLHSAKESDIVGNASTATKLKTPRAINGVLFDGTQDISLPVPEAYTLPTASASVLGGIKVGSGLSVSNSVLSVGTLNQDTTGNAATATKLQTASSIGITGSGVSGSVSFDGTGNINIPLAVTTQASTTNNTTIATTAFVQAVNATDTGSSATTLKLKTARTIGGIQFDGSANIDLPGVNTTGNQSTSGNAATATKLATARTISLTGAVTGSVNFDGTNNVNINTTIAGALGIANGGTGGTSAAEARTNLDVYSKDEVNTAITTSVPIVADATTIDKGIVRLATESDITSLSEIVAVTPKNVDDMLAGAASLTKGFCALLSVRLTQITGTNNSNANIITCNITGHGLKVGDTVSVRYRYRAPNAAQTAVDTVVITSVADVNTFTFTSPRGDAIGSVSNQQCRLFYLIKNNYNVDSLTIIGGGGVYTISINTNSGITGTNFIPFAQVATADNSLAVVQVQEITSPTSLTVRTFNASGSLIIPQWLHIGVTK